MFNVTTITHHNNQLSSPFSTKEGCDYVGITLTGARLTRLDIFFFPLSMWLPRVRWKAFKLLSTGIGFYCRLELPSCDIRIVTSDGEDR